MTSDFSCGGVPWRPEHLGVAAQDPGALRDWYVQVVGARELYTDGKVPPAFILGLGGGWVFEIYSAGQVVDGVTDNRVAGLRHLALRVVNLEEARAVLESRGVRFEEPVRPAGGGGRVQFFRDPEGNLLHLVERPAEAPLAGL